LIHVSGNEFGNVGGLSFPLSNPVLTRCNVTIFTTPVDVTGLEPRTLLNPDGFVGHRIV
jgi:hypothetical protein